MTDVDDLLSGLVEGDQRALARAISLLEDRGPGHRDLVAGLFRRPGEATVVGVTGSPGVGKSTLVDEMVSAYRERGETVGVVAVDPSSPYTGGALLGDRVRLASADGDDGVFVRSMGARGAHGGLAAATMDAVRALSVASTDRVIVETVGAGQSEVAVVGTADTVVVVTQPGSGDDVQALKAGILEIGDVYVVNKADRPGADRAVRDLREMVEAAGGLGGHRVGPDGPAVDWVPPVVETVATTGSGTPELLAAIDDHVAFLDEAELREAESRRRTASAIRAHVSADVRERVDREIAELGGIDVLVDRVLSGDADPFSVAEALVDSVAGGGDAEDETDVNTAPDVDRDAGAGAGGRDGS